MSRERYFSNAYDIRNTRDELVTTIRERELNRTSTSLVLHGRGFSPYGLARNENIVHKLENFSNTTPPKNPIDGQLWWKRAETNFSGELYGFDTAIGSPSWRTVVPPSSGIGFNVTPGDGFDQTSGGLPVGSPLSVIIDLSAGRGIQLSSNAVGVQAGQIIHDNLVGFVANEHIDHAAIKLIAGAGLTNSGSPATITSNLSLNVGAGRGITVNTNDVSCDSTVLRTSSNQTVLNIKEFTRPVYGDAVTVSASVPSFGFSNDSDTGWYTSATNQISFTTGAVQRFRIEPGGVLRAIPSNYETLVIDDNDIPNKRYVDGAVSGGSNPTAETHVGYQSISGLTPNAKYLVNVYGRIYTAGTAGAWPTQSIKLRKGTTTVGGGTLVASTPSQTINWPDGSTPTNATFIVDMGADTDLNSTTDTRVGGGTAGYYGGTTWMHAVRISDPPPLGSPLPFSGAPELDDVDGSSSCTGSVIYPSAYDAYAAIIFGLGTGAYPYTYDDTSVAHGCGSSAAFLSYTQIGNDWLPGGGTPGDFELRANTVSLTGSGLTASGTTGSWLDLSSLRSFWLTKDGAGIGIGTWVLDFEIRQKTNPANTTGVVTYTLRVESVI